MESDGSVISKLEHNEDDSGSFRGIKPSNHPEEKTINLCQEEKSNSIEERTNGKVKKDAPLDMSSLLGTEDVWVKNFDNDSNTPYYCNFRRGVITETDPKAINRATQLEEDEDQGNNFSARQAEEKKKIQPVEIRPVIGWSENGIRYDRVWFEDSSRYRYINYDNGIAQSEKPNGWQELCVNTEKAENSVDELSSSTSNESKIALVEDNPTAHRVKPKIDVVDELTSTSQSALIDEADSPEEPDQPDDVTPSTPKHPFRRLERMMSWKNPREKSPKNGSGSVVGAKDLKRIAHRRNLTHEEHGLFLMSKRSIELSSQSRKTSNESPDLDLSKSLVAVDDVARFRDQRQGFFKKKPLKDVLKWQKFPLRKSLLRLSRKDNNTAVQIFATIRMFMGEQATKTPRKLLSKRVCSTGLSYPSLRDEIFLQLCKQTNANPNLDNAIEGWKLFVICAAAFAPSKMFEEELSTLLLNTQKNSQNIHLIPFAVWRFKKTIRLRPMIQPFELEEVNRITEKGVPSSMILFGGSLELIMSLQEAEGFTSKVPYILEACIEAILKLGGQHVKGIFRKAADKLEVFQLRERIESGSYEMVNMDPLVPADILKLWLRELSPPLFPEDLLYPS